MQRGVPDATCRSFGHSKTRLLMSTTYEERGGKKKQLTDSRLPSTTTRERLLLSEATRRKKENSSSREGGMYIRLASTAWYLGMLAGQEILRRASSVVMVGRCMSARTWLTPREGEASCAPGALGREMPTSCTGHSHRQSSCLLSSCCKSQRRSYGPSPWSFVLTRLLKEEK